jgi:hypothetical protein
MQSQSQNSMIVFRNTPNDFFEELRIFMLIGGCFLFSNNKDAQ